MIAIVAAAFAFEPVVETLDGGRIDWTAGRLLASAEGEHTTGAMRDVEAMEGNARHRLGPQMLELAREVRISSELDAGDLLDAGDPVADRLDANLALWEVYETRYFASGKLEMDGALALQPWLRPALTAGAKGKDRPAGSGTGGTSGIVLDARGVKGIKPAVAPRIVDQAGSELYSLATLTVYAASQRGPVVYVTDPADPAGVRRAGETPLVVTVSGVQGGCDLVLSATEAIQVRQAAEASPFLLNGQVVVVVSP